MTIAISLKTHEGLVLAADSASTVVTRAPDGQLQVVNVYDNANKVFNLLKGLPIAAATWGLGAIGESSISMLMKDLRLRFSGEDSSHQGWTLAPDNYSVQEVAERLRSFVFEEHYTSYFSDWPEKPDLGFYVVGYSSGATLAEEFKIDISQGTCSPATSIRPVTDTGLTWSGAIEPISRLVLGFSTMLPGVLQQNLGLQPQQVPAIQAILQNTLTAQLVQAAMPLQDAIDLAEFLTDTAIKFHRFAPGAPVVGGPIELAAITKHEGFKWVQRKYYYSESLNPPVTEGLRGSTKSEARARKAVTKTAAKKTAAKKTAAKKTAAKKTAAKKTAAKKTAAKKTAAFANRR